MKNSTKEFLNLFDAICVYLFEFEKLYKRLNTKIKQIADLRIGYHTQPVENGNVHYLQAKNFDDEGNQVDDIDNYIVLDDTNGLYLLKDGDVLFAAKGNRNFAWTYHSSFGPAVASSVFIVLRPDITLVKPDFITTIFNLPQSQERFQILAAGSSIASIRKSELEAFIIPLPTLDIQDRILQLKDIHSKELSLTRSIMEHKQDLYNSVINTLIFQDHGQEN
ncbi:MAG: restriction endonuclease subunit S [Ekhidna sp.]|uniref:restriction endonuclease subunit S n=1 Tax=Ekhidna sp. TaxID=2608089 RepID=UPI003297A2EA